MGNSPQIGLKNLAYAILTQDDVNGVAYSAPKNLAEAILAKIVPKTTTALQWADDGVSDMGVWVAETTAEFDVQDVPFAVQADLLGHTLVNGIITKKSTDLAPFVAIGYKSIKMNGKYRYEWLLKGKFETLEIDAETKTDKPKPQNPKLKGTFVKRTFDDAWIRQGDEDINAAVGATWFTAVEATADTTPPTLTSVTPLNNATLVAVGTTYAWLFSEAILPASVTAGNFFMVADVTGAGVAGALTQSADQKTITFTPTAALTAATAYRTIATTDVSDLSGNKLAQPQVNKFTTA